MICRFLLKRGGAIVLPPIQNETPRPPTGEGTVRLQKLNATAREKVLGCQGLWTPKWKRRAYLEHVHRRRGNRRSLRRDGDNMGSRRRSRVRPNRDTTKCDGN